MKSRLKKISLANNYTSKKSRRDILLGGVPKENWIANNPFVMDAATCKCGRSVYEHFAFKVGDHYTSRPYFGDLCPFLLLKEP